MEKQYYVYIMGSLSRTLYIGVTNDLVRRVYEHKQGLADGFIKKYNIKSLLYYEPCQDIRSAILREKQMKKWEREWKFNLIRRDNPEMRDLYSDLIR